MMPPTTHTHGCVYQVSVVVLVVVVLVLAELEDEAAESWANAIAVTKENTQNKLSFLNAVKNERFIKEVLMMKGFRV